MDYGLVRRYVRRPATRRAAFGSDTLLPGIGDEVVLFMVWPKIVGRLYVMTAATSEEDVLSLVQSVMGLRCQSLYWKSVVDSSLEGVAVRATCQFARILSGPNETPTNYFRRQFRPIAEVLSETWIVREPRDLELLGNVEDLSSDQVQSLVLHLRRAKRAAKQNLCELGWYYVFNPPLSACSVDFLTPLVGVKQALDGFKKPLLDVIR